MADGDGKGVGDALASLGTAITSPAKLAFAGFLLLAYKGALLGMTLKTFLWIAFAFIVIQVGHDDFLRIILNRWAHHLSNKWRWPKQDGNRQ